MSTAEPGNQAFAFELLKLLLQVAWADDEIAPEEAQALVSFAKAEALSEEQLGLLGTWIDGKAPLPSPNLGLLKSRRLEVMRAIKHLLGSDLRVASEEEAILGHVSELLR